MQKKSLLLIVFLFIFSFSNAQIVTSKKDAVAKGIYQKPTDKNPSTVAAAKTSSTKSVKKSDSKSRKSRSLINDKEDNDLIIEPLDNYLAMQMINNAMDFLGVNYRGGGTSKSGMDCSGMVTAVFDIFGMKLPRSSNAMAKVGEKLSPKEVKKGDLVFFKTNGRNTINHVGIVVEADEEEIKFIHSSTQKGVIISSTKEPYYKKSFAQANRVL